MIAIGKFNTMQVLRITPPGAYLGIDGDENEILLPNKYIPQGLDVGDHVDVFVHRDSEDRLLATTLTPKVQRDQFAYLQVRQVSNIGAFLDWGLEKDLFVPNNEQATKMEEGKWYVVYTYLDVETWRLVASSKTNKFLEKENIELEVGEEVDLLVCDRTNLGYNLIVNNLYSGLVFHNEIFKPLGTGMRLLGYVKQLRPDMRIDIALQPLGVAAIEPNALKILDMLQRSGGSLPFSDKSDPDEIVSQTGMSKKLFKKAIGSLYKARKIIIEENAIRLV